MPFVRKRPRDEGSDVLPHVKLSAGPERGEIFVGRSQQPQQCHYSRSRSSTRQLSFTLAPTHAIPLWQNVALAALNRVHERERMEHKALAHARMLQRDLRRYTEDLKRRKERLKVQQREMRTRLGNRLFAAVEKHWTKRGDVFQQLLSAEFDEVKRRHAERRQEDLLREAENLTRTLLEEIFSGSRCDGKNGKVVSAPSSTGGSDSCGNGGADTALDAIPGLPMIRDDMEASSSIQLESSLTLLDTQGGQRPLRDYQRSALRWLTNLYTKRLNGVLADEMGLGKTIQTIALLAYFAEHKNDWGPHLIVVPTTVVLNWKAEFQRWCPGLRVIVYTGSRKERHKLRQGWMREDAFHVCITSYNMVIYDRMVFRRRPWGFLILDEAHQLKNFLSKRWQSLFDLQTEYRLLLTGTPLQNSIMELWSLFHFLLPSASAFSSDEEFREWFSNPMDDMVSGRTALNEDIVRRLQALLRPFMLRRLKKDVESQLPSKTEKVVMCKLSRRQRMLYDDYMQLTETREKIRGGVGGVLGVLLALRKVCNHPDMFEERRTITPMALDRQSEITVVVPRSILLLGNSYSGRYRFQKWRLCIDDVSLSPYSYKQQDEQQECDISWLDCALLHPLIVDQCWMKDGVREEYLQRFSSKHFSWVSEQVCCNEASGGVCQEVSHLFRSYADREKRRTAQRQMLTCAFQTLRSQCLEAGVCVWQPSCFNVVVPGHREGGEEPWKTEMLHRHRCVPPFLCPTVAQRVQAILPVALKVAVYVPCVVAAHPPRLHCHLPVSHYQPFRAHCRRSLAPLLVINTPPPVLLQHETHPRAATFDASHFLSEIWPFCVRRCFSFPDRNLLIHDCGKLQFLQHCLKQLRRDGHRMLIFTQFVHMLNILEQFLAIIGVSYLRIDGSTKAERRQAYVDRFNDDERVTCMILSTRSGGIGLNLTGADTVIFYDSDWNPTMDLQAQDRCHRIGQTKPVTIYRLISEHTVEESILQKARERKKLNNVVIRGGQFHTMASVDEMYEDTSAAIAAFSDPVRLRSFFHDLDEDATVITERDSTEAVIAGERGRVVDDNEKPVDLRAEMMKLEDQEDREAQQNLEDELRRLEEDEKRDEAELGGAEEDEDEAQFCSDCCQMEGEEALESKTAASTAADSEPSGSAAAAQKRREILRRQRTPLDRLLAERFGLCHAAEARRRYDVLCSSYRGKVGDDKLPEFIASFSL
ncbi:Type III restriction enzyme res subunit SNF2 family N terminal domain [Trypanosoma vivax]|uniref:Putative ATP-dependent helicase n=1 Tax=Trypanosoma vivax (strain Y486) TaxID=1055687 RepID=G0UCX0_TRYVY|nr:putative ATP-dependent helicase [Trypanosoma vivax]KAH8608255.1 Type III restriction enzyme res subunit SNF2 family N terminal domain [Trypanosoma vivax]CCC53680.1 putative ATP-dependent helicase [Trypanosoma vivax Y486]